jgi:hypothetical protein
MMITLDTITTELDALARALDGTPGRCPQDAQIACTLLAYVMTGLQGTPSTALLSTLHSRGVEPQEAREVARAVQGLALRLGAWLGRSNNAQEGPCAAISGTRGGTRVI